MSPTLPPLALSQVTHQREESPFHINAFALDVTAALVLL